MKNSSGTATNPSSNLHFDFPDPTPRFEFDDSPARSSSTSSSFATKRVGAVQPTTPVKNSLKARLGGRFTTKRGGRKKESSSSNNNGSSSPSGRSCDFSLTENTTTTSTTACSTPSGSVVTPGSSSHTSRSSGDGRNSNESLFELDDAQLHGGIHRKALSYVSAGSESEFSFDRVTVTTNETGFSNSKMSSIDWGFIEGLGSSSGGGGGGGGANNNDGGNGHTPPFVIAAGLETSVYTTAKTLTNLNENGGVPSSAHARGGTVVPPPVIERKSPITRRPSSPLPSQNHKLSINRLSPTIMGQDLRRTSSSPRGGAAASPYRLHLPHNNSSSLHGSDVPVFKSVESNVDDQSVISEISERTGAFMDDDNNNDDINANDAVRALLRGGGMEEESPNHGAITTVRYKMNGYSGFSGGGNTSSPAASTKGQTIETPSYIHRQHQRLRSTKSSCCKNDTTFSLSSSMTTIKSLLDDVQTKYVTYKATHSGSSTDQQQQQQEKEKLGQEHQCCSIHSIIEDIQFCGYLCGIDTTLASPKQQQQKDTAATLEKTMLDAKEVRKKEAELTFLGKDIAVCGARSGSSTTGGRGGGGRDNWCTQL